MALGAHSSLRLLEAIRLDEEATCREGTGLPPPPGLATKPGTPWLPLVPEVPVLET